MRKLIGTDHSAAMSTSARTSPIEPDLTTYSSTPPSWAVTSADGTEIAVYEFGGAGETLLVAHATGFCATMYRPLGVELVDRFRIVALDFRGHGRSARPVGATTSVGIGWPRTCSPSSGASIRRSPASVTRWAGPPSCSPRNAVPGRSAACSCSSRSCFRTTSHQSARTTWPSWPAGAGRRFRHATRRWRGTPAVRR